MTNPRVTAEQLTEDREWARNFLTRCGADPDDQDDVRAVYGAARDDYAKWMVGLGGEVDAETCGTLVYAIRAAFGWLEWPMEWPAPTLVCMAHPFRNLLTREPLRVEYMSGVSDEDREWAKRTVIEAAKEVLLETEERARTAGEPVSVPGVPSRVEEVLPRGMFVAPKAGLYGFNVALTAQAGRRTVEYAPGLITDDQVIELRLHVGKRVRINGPQSFTGELLAVDIEADTGAVRLALTNTEVRA